MTAPSTRLTLVPAASATALLPLCSTYAEGTLSEGIALDPNHARAEGPALAIGSVFVRLASKNSCHMTRTGSIRRAAIHWSGKAKPVPCFVEPAADTTTLLLFATVDTAPLGFEPVDGLWSGIVHPGDQIAYTGDQQQMLIGLKNDGDTVDIFCPTGVVKRIVREDGALALVALSTEEQFEARIQLSLENAVSRNPKVRDYAWGQMISILSFAASRELPDMFEKIYDLLEHAGASGSLSRALIDRAETVISRTEPEWIPYFLDRCKIRKAA